MVQLSFDKYCLRPCDKTEEFQKDAYGINTLLIANANWITSRKIQKYTGYKDVYIRKCIRYLRLEGCPIATSPKGFKYTDDLKELEKTIENLRNRAEAIFTVRDRLLHTFQVMKRKMETG